MGVAGRMGVAGIFEGGRRLLRGCRRVEDGASVGVVVGMVIAKETFVDVVALWVDMGLLVDTDSAVMVVAIARASHSQRLCICEEEKTHRDVQWEERNVPVVGIAEMYAVGSNVDLDGSFAVVVATARIRLVVVAVVGAGGAGTETASFPAAVVLNPVHPTSGEMAAVAERRIASMEVGRGFGVGGGGAGWRRRCSSFGRPCLRGCRGIRTSFTLMLWMLTRCVHLRSVGCWRWMDGR